jgi:hypothetical protein
MKGVHIALGGRRRGTKGKTLLTAPDGVSWEGEHCGREYDGSVYPDLLSGVVARPNPDADFACSYH